MSMLNRKHPPLVYDPGWLTLRNTPEVEPALDYVHKMPPNPKHANRPRSFPRTRASNELRTSEGTIKNPVLTKIRCEDGTEIATGIVAGADFKPKKIKVKKQAQATYANAVKHDRAMPIKANDARFGNNADVD